jgi:hypothetical protein
MPRVLAVVWGLLLVPDVTQRHVLYNVVVLGGIQSVKQISHHQQRLLAVHCSPFSAAALLHMSYAIR